MSGSPFLFSVTDMFVANQAIQGCPIVYTSYTLLTTAFCLCFIYLIWYISLCWQSMFLKHSWCQVINVTVKWYWNAVFLWSFVSIIELFVGKYALQIRILGENSALTQALTSVIFVIASVDSYYSVVIEHALIYQFAGTKILETLENQST